MNSNDDRSAAVPPVLIEAESVHSSGGSATTTVSLDASASWTEEAFLRKLQGRDVRIELLVRMDGGPDIRTATLLDWDNSYLVVKTRSGSEMMIGKHAIAYMFEAPDGNTEVSGVDGLSSLLVRSP